MKIWIEIDEKDLTKVKAVLGQEEAAGKKPEKADNKKAADTKAKKEELARDPEPEAESGDYESMKAADLYKLCCERGISSQCKKRDKASLIAVLRANEGGADPEPEEDTDDDWGDDPEPEEKDPYAGKTARELYKMCIERGLKVKKQLAPEAYAKVLKEDDAKGTGDEDSEDDWEV